MPANLRRVKIAAFATAALSSGLLVAADVGGVISGAVVDSSGAAVPLARVSLALEGRPIRRQLVSGPSGKYRAGGLPAGSYTVTAWSGLNGASGERKVVLRDGQELEATITLSDAAVSDSDLPLERSNPLDLVRFAPEITPGEQGGNIEGWGPYGLRGNLGFNSYGQRSQDNGFLLDGVDNNDAWVRGPLILPLLEEVGSVTVDGGALRAELGHAAGAVVRIATRAGSSRLHGSAFEYWRNAELDARNFFDGAKPVATTNRFGGSVGGPIRRDKWFLFADAEILRERQGLTITSTVPTRAEKAGDFGASTIYDPSTIHEVGINFDLRDPFPGNRIPANRIPEPSRGLAALYPDPLTPGPADNYAFRSALRQNSVAFGARSDYHSSSHGASFVRLSGGSLDRRSPLAFPGGGSDVSQLADGVNAQSNWRGGAVGHTLPISPTLVNEFRAGVTYYDLHTRAGGTDASVLRMAGLSADALPYFVVSGFTSLGTPGGPPFATRQLAYDASDQVVWKTARHSWTFGTETVRRHVDGDASEWSSRGAFFFTPDFTSQPGIAGTGDAFASLLLGFPSEVRRDAQFQPYHLRGWELAAFAQDSIRLGRRLTIEAGVRYSLDPPITEANGRMLNFNFSLQSPAVDVSGRYAGVGYNKRTFAPRIGFAFDASGNGSVVFRGGFSQDYDNGSYIATGALARNPPFASRLDIVNGTYQLGPNLTDPLPPLSPVPPSDPTGFSRVRGAVYAIQQAHYTPYSDQWVLALDLHPQQGLTFEIGGMGSMGIHLFARFDANQPYPAPTPYTFRRYPYDSFHERVDYLSFAGGSTYYGGVFKAKGQLRSRLQFEAGYAYAKSLDDATAPGTDQQSRPAIAQFVYNPRGARSPSPFDITQRLIATASYDLPFRGHTPNGRLWALSNWRVSAIATLQTGFPFTPELSTSSLNDGGFQLPNRVGGGSLPAEERSYLQWFNTSLNPNDPARAFQIPSLYKFGNSGFDILRGPAMVDVDTAIARRFPVRERLWLDMRAEAFNLLNRTNFALPDRILGAESAGVINHTATGARQLQLTVRMEW